MFNIVSTYNIGSTLDVLASILEEQYYLDLIILQILSVKSSNTFESNPHVFCF